MKTRRCLTLKSSSREFSYSTLQNIRRSNIISGTISFFLGLFGLGAAGAINAGQNISQSKKQAELDQIYTAQAADRSDADIRQMHEQVRKEWWSIPDFHPNCLGKWPSAYSDRMGPYYQTKFWFRDHLNAKGIPYDDAILDEVCGVNYEKLMNKMLDDAVHGRRRRRWF